MKNAILLDVKFTVKPGKRDEFYAKVAEQGVISDSQAEAGNFKYEYSASMESKDVLCLLEIWESEESLTLHGQTPHYLNFQAMKQEYVTDVSIEKYVISEKL